MIKVILRHVVSKPDVFGNRCWIHQLIKSSTKDSMWFQSAHSSNAENLVKMATGWDWDKLYSHQEDISIRRFNRIEKDLTFAPYDKREETIRFFLTGKRKPLK